MPVATADDLKLPAGFHWGYATAAQQIEGGTSQDGRGPSIWDEFAKSQSEKVKDGSNADVTCNSYNLWRNDIALMKQYRVTAYRFSLSWPRIIPLGGRDDPVNPLGVKYYSDLIDGLLEAGIVPFVTLYHWDFPQTLEERYGGWRNKEESIKDYVRYARVCFDAYGDRVKHWLTFNEPYVITIPGWFNGDCAPGRSSKRPYSKEGDSATEPWIVGHHLMLAHAHAAKLYHDEYAHSGGVIGITLNGDWAEAWDESEASRQAVERKMAAAIGWFADPIFLGRESTELRNMLGDRLPTFLDDEWALLKNSSDFYGCNTYTTNLIKDGGDDESLGLTELTWERPDGSVIGEACECEWLTSVHWGFRKHLNYLYDRYKLPIYVTECGFAVKDEGKMPLDQAINDQERADFHLGYLDNLLLAVRKDGVDVRSYFGWTLMDNWEWAEGYGPRFGVTYVDYETGKRTPKLSSRLITEWFQNHLSTKAVAK